MKKYTSVIVILILCFTLSINSFAIGNTYTFTSSWTHAVLQNSLLVNNSTDYSYTVKDGNITADGILYNNSFDNDSFCVWLKSDTSLKSGTTSITIPLNLDMYTGVEYLELDFFIAYSNSVNFDSATVRVGSSNLSTTTTVTDYNSVDFGHMSFSSPNANIGSFVSDYSGKGKLINVRYLKTLSSTAQTIDSITLNFTNTASSFAIGIPCYNQVVTLPDSFYDAIYSIKIYERLNYNELVQINYKITELQGQIDQIIGKIGSTTEEQNNYYNTIINQSPEQAEKLAALQADLQQAKQELAEMQNVFNSYTPPVPAEVLPDEQATRLTLDSINNKDSSSVYGFLFGNDIFLNLLVITVSVATIGYILYGKRA